MASATWNINWYDKDSVIKYARTLGRGWTVFKHADAETFKITLTTSVEHYAGSKVVYQSTEKPRVVPQVNSYLPSDSDPTDLVVVVVKAAALPKRMRLPAPPVRQPEQHILTLVTSWGNQGD